MLVVCCDAENGCHMIRHSGVLSCVYCIEIGIGRKGANAHWNDKRKTSYIKMTTSHPPLSVFWFLSYFNICSHNMQCELCVCVCVSLPLMVQWQKCPYYLHSCFRINRSLDAHSLTDLDRKTGPLHLLHRHNTTAPHSDKCSNGIFLSFKLNTSGRTRKTYTQHIHL